MYYTHTCTCTCISTCSGGPDMSTVYCCQCSCCLLYSVFIVVYRIQVFIVLLFTVYRFYIQVLLLFTVYKFCCLLYTGVYCCLLYTGFIVVVYCIQVFIVLLFTVYRFYIQVLLLFTVYKFCCLLYTGVYCVVVCCIQVLYTGFIVVVYCIQVLLLLLFVVFRYYCCCLLYRSLVVYSLHILLLFTLWRFYCCLLCTGRRQATAALRIVPLSAIDSGETKNAVIEVSETKGLSVLRSWCPRTHVLYSVQMCNYDVPSYQKSTCTSTWPTHLCTCECTC